MLQDIEIEGGTVRVHVLLTIEGCPLKDRITTGRHGRRPAARGRRSGRCPLTPMSPEQREALVQHAPRRLERRRTRRPPPRRIGFPASTSVIAIASGKGGVGKSSVTVNLAAALAAEGKKRRRPRRRRLGVQRPAHAGRQREAGRVQRHDPAARRPRREGDLHGILRARGDAGHLARAHAPQGDRAVPGRRLLGRPGLPAVRPAAGNRRREHLARLVPAGRLDAGGHHAAGGRSQGGRARRQDGRAHQPAARSAWSRT